MADNPIIPDHYGGRDDPYEVFKVIRAWEVNFFLGNALKYIRRAGKKDPSKQIEDLMKAREYLNSEIEELETISAKTTSSESRKGNKKSGARRG